MPDQTFHLPCLTARDAIARFERDTVQLLDLRKPAAAAQSRLRIRGALVRDPLAFSHDDPLTKSTSPVVVFCVHGHEVSQFGCALLRLHGVEASYVGGGFEALVAAGAPVEALS